MPLYKSAVICEVQISQDDCTSTVNRIEHVKFLFRSGLMWTLLDFTLGTVRTLQGKSVGLVPRDHRVAEEAAMDSSTRNSCHRRSPRKCRGFVSYDSEEVYLDPS